MPGVLRGSRAGGHWCWPLCSFRTLHLGLPRPPLPPRTCRAQAQWEPHRGADVASPHFPGDTGQQRTRPQARLCRASTQEGGGVDQAACQAHPSLCPVPDTTAATAPTTVPTPHGCHPLHGYGCRSLHCLRGSDLGRGWAQTPTQKAPGCSPGPDIPGRGDQAPLPRDGLGRSSGDTGPRRGGHLGADWRGNSRPAGHVPSHLLGSVCPVSAHPAQPDPLWPHLPTWPPGAQGRGGPTE